MKPTLAKNGYASEYLGYKLLMDLKPAYISFKIDISEPIELPNLMAFFSSLSSQFEDFMRREYPDLAPDAKIFVHEIRSGCIEGELVPIAMTMIEFMDRAVIVEEFTKRWGARISRYFSLGGRDPTAKKADLKDVLDATVAIATDPNANVKVKALAFEDEELKVKVALQFDTRQARIAQAEASSHRLELSSKSSSDEERVLMTFVRPSKKLGARAGEQVVIPAISQKVLPVYYASPLAEQRIKHEIITGVIMQLGFIVDVDIDMRANRPFAYRVKAVHDVISISEEEPPEEG